MSATTAHIIAIGDEILYGQTLDANSNFIAQQFSKFNINLKEISIIADDVESIRHTIQQSEADIIVTTGGLGPTKDDKTKFVIAELLNQDLILNEEALEWTKAYYENVVNRPMNDLNKNQALAPKGSILLKNKVGTAPGIWSDWNDKIIINLPGVPYEMKYLITQEVLPKIKEELNTEFIIHHFIYVLNIPESELAQVLESFENNLPQHIKLAYLPSAKLVKLRLTTIGKDQDKLKKELSKYAEEITQLIPENVINDNNQNLLEKVGELLTQKNLKLATAESFTSGRIATQITSISGSSAYFNGGIIAYSPALKSRLLHVSNDVIQTKGMVNEEVAKQMALGVLSATESDIAVSSTGVAGPSADEFGISAGTAFIGIAYKKKVLALKFEYKNLDRYEFTEKLTQIAIQQLYLFLKDL